MAAKKKIRDGLAFDIINYTIISLILLIILYPLFFTISASVSNPSQVLAGKVLLMPKGFNLNGYDAVFQNKDLMNGYKNSIYVVVVGTAVNLFMTTLCAYPLSRPKLHGKGFITVMVTVSMFFSGGVIPLYLVVKNLGLLNSLFALILPGAISTYNMIIMRTYFQTSVPMELQEAAKIDGCGHFQTLFMIMLPLSGAVFGVLGLYYAVAHWNSYFSALIYLTKKNKYPLQLILREILLNTSTMNETYTDSQEGLDERLLVSESIKYAAIVISSLPFMIVYPFIQKLFVKGVMIGAIKG